MKYLMVLFALVLGACFCGNVAAQEKSAESPGSTAQVITIEKSKIVETEGESAESPGSTASVETTGKSSMEKSAKTPKPAKEETTIKKSKEGGATESPSSTAEVTTTEEESS